MNEKSKTLHGQDAGFQGKRAILPEKSETQYNDKAELIQEGQQLERDVRHYRSVTPEPRVCVYRIASSVPFANAAALRKTGRYF